jgi:hypothetical protein
MKTLKECQSFLGRLESRIPVNEWTLEGVRIWPLIRILIVSRHTLSLRGSDRPTPESTTSAKAGRLWDSIRAPFRETAKNLPRSAPAEVFILTYAGIRQARLGGEYVDIRTGPLIDHLAARKISCHAWEYAVPHPYRFPRRNPTHLVQREFYAAQFWNRVLGRRIRDVHLPGYSGFCDALASRGVLYDEILEKNLLREFGLILSLRDRFERAFDTMNPAVAFTSNLGRYEFALNLACRRRNIPSVELQHGVQGPHNAHYAAWNRIPRDGYDLFPHAFWCWDEGSAATINQWADRCDPRHQAVAGGIPWLQYCASLPAEIPDSPEGRKTGLVTLSPPERVYADARLLPDFVLDALSRVGKDWAWWVRPHPAWPCDTVALGEEFRRRGIDARIDGIDTAPLPHLLARADLHLTHSSSTVLEAETFGLGSIVWSTMGADLYKFQVASGICRTALDADALVREIHRTSDGKAARPESKTPPFEQTLARFLDLGRSMKAERKR